jgi:hypothetical protein
VCVTAVVGEPAAVVAGRAVVDDEAVDLVVVVLDVLWLELEQPAATMLHNTTGIASLRTDTLLLPLPP